ncbi:hypothetical protein N9E91_02130 [Alphaproteobacteria bacterium]|jgi:hypothetical protein|nr:hypothetical protein [Alphaproteobacteria bacterium]
MFEVTPSRNAAMRRALLRLHRNQHGITSLQFLDSCEVDALIKMAEGQSFRRAKPIIQHQGRKVSQDFDVCFPAPRKDSFDRLASLLEAVVRDASVEMPNSVLPENICFNDFAIQRYAAGSSGIGIHRDGKSYRNLVIIITLAGASRLFTCDDREGRNRRVIDDRPGRIVLLSAEGFGGYDGQHMRPLHGVDSLVGGRLSLGFRHLPTIG